MVGGGDEIQVGDLPPEVATGRESAAEPDGESGVDALHEMERRLLSRVLAETGWNIHEASRRLEISRPTLYSKIKKFTIKEK